jgi:hypothetical protein
MIRLAAAAWAGSAREGSFPGVARPDHGLDPAQHTAVGTVADAAFVEDGLELVADGVRRGSEARRDGRVLVAAGRQLGDLALARRQGGDPFAGAGIDGLLERLGE